MVAANQQSLKENPLLLTFTLKSLQAAAVDGKSKRTFKLSQSLMSSVSAADFSLTEEKPDQQRLMLLLCIASER